MGSMIDQLYQKMPRGLQNLGLSVYGYKQYRLRYGQALPAPYDNLQHDALPGAALKQAQNLRLRQLVAHAAEHVPYYKALFARLKVAPGDITLDNFTQVIPVLEKSEIVADPQAFHSDAYRDNAIRLFTSGTSGSPMPILCAPEARAINYGFYRSMLLQRGCDVRDRSATLAGRTLVAKDESSIFWRRDSFNRTLYLSSYHLKDTTIPRYIEALEAWQPLYIDSYPSAVGEIARFICERGIKHRIRPKFVLTSSETLSEVQRQHITEAFHCDILDHYGCTEMAVSAYTRIDGSYYIEPLYSLIEFAPAAVPGNASLLCTGLLNMAMPLLRYKIGDTVSGATEASPFYRQHFAAVVGREDDLVITPDGRRIGRLDPAFKGLDGIKLAQIIQTSLDNLDVLIVPAEGCNRKQVVPLLTENLKRRTSEAMTISIQFVEQIPLSKSGKFKSVISRIRQ